VTRALGWVVAALAGLVLAVAISYAASTLSSQHVGLSSEPLTAGDRLVPHATAPTATPPPTRTPTGQPTATTTAQPPTGTPPPAASGEDGGGDD
jgi:hypothetical protein